MSKKRGFGREKQEKKEKKDKDGAALNWKKGYYPKNGGYTTRILILSYTPIIII